MHSQSKSITRWLLAVVLIGVPAVAAAAASWRDAPEYVALFAPVVHREAYRMAVSPDSLDRVLAEIASDETLARAPGAWEPRRESPQDAFGTAGPYNRWMLAQAYGGRPVRVARGVRMERGLVVEAWTLLSPYPSPDLRTLQTGTLRLILRVAP